ncbi:mucin-2-like [Engraulis encrasicolus]|uniref:mucin-2-like n=1 Tax=Engraulis encrasicolus TaxID=184585 RepID=UPI002FD4852E
MLICMDLGSQQGPYEGHDFIPPSEKESSTEEEEEEDVESTWELRHAPSLTYRSLETGSASLCSGDSSSIRLPSVGESFTEIHHLPDLRIPSVEELEVFSEGQLEEGLLPRLSEPVLEETSSKASVRDRTTIPEAWTTDTHHAEPPIRKKSDTSTSRRSSLRQTTSSLSRTKTSHHPASPDPQGPPVSRFAKIRISTSKSKAQVKPKVKKSKTRTGAGPPPPHPILPSPAPAAAGTAPATAPSAATATTPGPALSTAPAPPSLLLLHHPPPLPHAPPSAPAPAPPPRPGTAPPTTVASRKQLTGPQDGEQPDFWTQGQFATSSITPSDETQILNRRKSSSRSSLASTKLERRASRSLSKPRAAADSDTAPTPTPQSPRAGSVSRLRSHHKHSASKDKKAGKNGKRKASKSQKGERMRTTSRLDGPPVAHSQQSQVGLCTLVDHSERAKNVPASQADTKKKKQKQRKKSSKSRLTPSDALSAQHVTQEQGKDGGRDANYTLIHYF